jgi:SulP family sulfate permease
VKVVDVSPQKFTFEFVLKQLKIPNLRKPLKYLIDHLQLECFPMFRQLKGYRRSDLIGDLRAGLNVALLGFPQGMAYAMIAKLPLQYGVYCSAAAALLAPWLSRSGLVVLGPTNATAVMLLSIFLTLPPEVDRLTATTTLVFLVGIFLLIGAFLQVASLLKFVSRSVIIGYITGAALLIIANQLSHVFGTQVAGSSGFFPTVIATARSLPEIHWTAFAVALSAIATIFVVRKYFPRLPDAAIALVVGSLVGMALAVWGEPSANLNPISISSWHPTPPALTPEWIFLLSGPALAVGFLAAM